MARRFSRKKGQAGSKKPLIDKPKPWLSYSNTEIEQLVTKLAKTGKSTSQIGIILRDSYGIPDVKKYSNKKVTTILKEHKLQSKLPEDLTNLIKKELSLHKHIGKYNRDMTSRRGLILTQSKIRGLTKYYKRKKLLIRINGNPIINRVSKNIKKVLIKYQQQL